jgi:hypothetical protein
LIGSLERWVSELVNHGFCLLGDDFWDQMPALSSFFSPSFITDLIQDMDFCDVFSFLLLPRRGAKAQDPRDIVYSLPGVADLAGVQEIEPEWNALGGSIHFEPDSSFLRTRISIYRRLLSSAQKSPLLCIFVFRIGEWNLPLPKSPRHS